MGIISRIVEKRQLSSLDTKDPVLIEALGGRPTAAGISMDEHASLGLSAVYACVRCISEDVAKLPIILYRRTGESEKERAKDHNLYNLLRYQPNPLQTAFSFVQTMQAAALLYGNAYAWIDWDRGGRVIALWYLHPTSVEPFMQRDDQGRPKLMYRVHLQNGVTEVFGQDRILHIPALGFDGISGKSVIRYFRESLATYAAAHEFAARYFGNDTTPGLILTSPRKLSEDERSSIRADFASKYGGVSRKFRLAVLESGWEIKPLTVPLEDAQFIQLAKFGVEDIARIFRVPPHKIGHLERATFSNIEHQSMEYQADTIEPWIVKWEQELSRKLLLGGEREEYFIEFLMDVLLRADTISRYRAYATGIQWGFLSPNEARAKENLPPRPGAAEKTWMPVNMMPSEGSPPEGGEAGQRNVAQKRGLFIRRSRRDVVEAARIKQRVALSYRKQIEAELARLLRRETNDIVAKISKLGISEDLYEWYRNDYQPRHKEYVVSGLRDVMSAEAEAVQALVAAEVQGFAGITPRMQDCVDMHAERVADRLLKSNASALHGMVLDKVSEADARKTLQSWIFEIAPRIAAWESIRISGLVSKAEYHFHDLPFQWVRLDGLSPCELLDGRVLEPSYRCEGNPFLSINDRLQLKNGREFVPGWNVTTPPVTDGCTCQIMAVFD